LLKGRSQKIKGTSGINQRLLLVKGKASGEKDDPFVVNVGANIERGISGWG
jgi:hypothetical protein